MATRINSEWPFIICPVLRERAKCVMDFFCLMFADIQHFNSFISSGFILLAYPSFPSEQNHSLFPSLSRKAPIGLLPYTATGSEIVTPRSSKFFSVAYESFTSKVIRGFNSLGGFPYHSSSGLRSKMTSPTIKAISIWRTLSGGRPSVSL